MKRVKSQNDILPSSYETSMLPPVNVVDDGSNKDHHLLPIHKIELIMKEALKSKSNNNQEGSKPKIHSEAASLMQQLVTEFICYVTSE